LRFEVEGLRSQDEDLRDEQVSGIKFICHVKMFGVPGFNV